MFEFPILNRMSAILPTACARLSRKEGNILIYIVMIMVIFGLLGALMVSLFSTSISSSATTNEARRAFYLSESGLRYGMSELRNRGFSDSVIDPLNQTVFNLQPSGEFDLNIFSYWFDFDSGSDIGGSGSGTITVDIPKGDIPPGIWSSAPANLFLVDCNFMGQNPQDSARALVTGFTIDPINRKSLDIQLSDDESNGFIFDIKPQLCFAVNPESDQTIVASSNPKLKVDAAARDIFPKTGGAIEVKRRRLFYRSAVDKESHVELTDITFEDSGTPSEAVEQASDYVILPPRNYVVLSKGQSGHVTFGGEMANSIAVASSPGDLKPDIGPDNLDYTETGSFDQNESTSNFFQLDQTEKSIIIGGGIGSRFGSIFFSDTRNIGGIREYCLNGACFFDLGFRAFFIMNSSGDNGDGMTFSVLNAYNNDAGSVGGDVQLSELLAFGGDSRTVISPTGPADYLDGKGEGLELPKMAVEFDGFYNNTPVGYCADADDLNFSTRYDPEVLGGGRDAVQYVFWGNRFSLLAPCRGNSPLYDDNRHNSQDNPVSQWTNFSVKTQDITQRVKIGPDGTIYAVFGDSGKDSDSRLLALNPISGVQKWEFPTVPDVPGTGVDDDLDAIAIDNAGNIYLGSDYGKAFAVNPNGTKKWEFSPPSTDQTNRNIETPIAVDESLNRIYFGGGSILYALNKSNGDSVWRYPLVTTLNSPIRSGVTQDPEDGTIYFGTDNESYLYALKTDGTLRWKHPSSESIRTQPVVNPSNRDIIFVGSNENSPNAYVYALQYSGTSPSRPLWTYHITNEVQNALAVSPDGNTVYVGTLGGVLHALDATNGTLRWRYPSSSGVGGAIRGKPAVGQDGTVYFGSDNGRVYALNPDTGALTDAQRLKWVFPSSGSIGSVRSGIEIGKDENILFISEDGKLYSVIPFTAPRNIRNLHLTDIELDAGVSDPNWFGKGPWAVRVEVIRGQSVNANGKYEYTLKTWMKKCDDSACFNVLGGFFQNTRFEYDYANESVPITPLTQTIELDSDFHERFNRFLFGFTSASTEAQTIEIRKFQLSFIRPNDPKVND